ncbi:MAG: cupin domain-containing protein, partial [SAR324 cluster bacterium]|nr:cupin domain-containing protein [SAR324 cluster bacterium]
AGTWLRQPDGRRHSPSSREGCTLWVKGGHLPATGSH